MGIGTAGGMCDRVGGVGVIIAAALAGAAAACGGGQTNSAPVVNVGDSAGVRLVRVPPLGSFSMPELDVVRLYSTADVGGAPLELFRVRDALFLADGTLVLANGGTEEIVFVDPAGRSHRRFGGKGQGPGEFNGLSRLLARPGGGFLAWDYRLSRFDHEGAFIATLRLDPSSRVVSVAPLAVHDDGRIVAVLGEQRYFQRSGERRDTVPLMVYTPDRAQPDTVGTWPGLERAFGELRGSATFIVPIGFARTAFSASNGGRVAIGSSDSLDVTVFDADLKAVLRLVAPAAGRAPTPAQQKAWREFALARLPMDDEQVRTAWSEAPIRGTFPGFDGLDVDPEGRLWLSEATVPGSARRRWVVFAADGTPLAEWEPLALWPSYLPGRTELLALGGDRVALLRRDQLDEESVEVWRINW
ncbi:MAG: hypothetical protein AMXMBFR53_24660 [Gemmatimonadota bacterium]